MDSSTPRPDPDSVLGRLQPRALDPDTALDYEITRELIGRVLALYSAHRAELEQAHPVDHRALDAVGSQQGRFAQLMQSLDPADTESVARVRAQCADILRRADASGQ
jgi:hypothetical protein